MATRRRLRAAAADLLIGRAPLVTGIRFCCWCATALWLPILLLDGDTTDRASAYDLIVVLAATLHVPPLPPLLAPAELLLLLMAGTVVGFSAVDYLVGGSRFAPARVWLGGLYWTGLAASWVVSNPIAYGSWLFVGIAALHWWCLARTREERGDRAGGTR